MAPILNQVKVKNLRFDPDNPRLPDKLKHSDDASVLTYFLKECNLVELMLSISEKDYFAGEPLMVVANPDQGTYTVVEGNRRLGALKLLSGEIDAPVMPIAVAQILQTAKFAPKEVPVLIFDARDEILSYLGYRHITGIKEWDALAKARYLVQLRALHDEDHEKAHKALAKEIGSKSTYVAKLLTGYELLQRAEDAGILKRLKVAADDLPFSLLTTGIGWESIASFIGLNSGSDVEMKNLKIIELEEFFKWVFDKSSSPHTVLGESRNFPKLARIVANPGALDMLRRGESIDNADLLTSGPLEAIRDYMSRAENAIKIAQQTLNITEGLSKADLEQAQRLRKASAAFHSSVEGALKDIENADD